MPIPPDILLLVVAGALLIFMFWSSSRRRKKMQAQEQERQQSLVPGTPVMTRAGIYGTLVEFDADDLTKRAVIEIAPDVNVEVHAQTVTIDQDSIQAAEADPEDADDVEGESRDDQVEEFDGDLQGEQPLDDVSTDDVAGENVTDDASDSPDAPKH